MADVFDLDLDVDTVTVGDSDEDDIIEVDEVIIVLTFLKIVILFTVDLTFNIYNLGPPYNSGQSSMRVYFNATYICECVVNL